MLESSKHRVRIACGATVLRLGLVPILQARLARGGWPTVLYYHRVGPIPTCDLDLAVSPANFEAQVAFLASHFTVRPLDDLLARWERGQATAREIAITFDDGYRDNYVHAYPILRKAGLPATVFVTTDYVGQANRLWWDRIARSVEWARSRVDPRAGLQSTELPEDLGRLVVRVLTERNDLALTDLVSALKGLPKASRLAAVDGLCESLGSPPPSYDDRDFLSWSELAEMCTHGFQVGTHTHTHAILTETSDHDIRRELQLSRRLIEAHLAVSVDTLAYPDGCVDFGVRRIVEELGFRFALQTQRATAPRGDRLAIPRKQVKERHSLAPDRTFSAAAFATEVTGLADVLFLRRQRRRNPYIRT